uniref:Uncharacterized protein n=1 Tax=Arundo donax TaxID=35708 RepID=A0A0A9A678_ARUDO
MRQLCGSAHVRSSRSRRVWRLERQMASEYENRCRREVEDWDLPCYLTLFFLSVVIVSVGFNSKSGLELTVTADAQDEWWRISGHLEPSASKKMAVLCVLNF